jgi:PAS domain S-box-containing protein
VEESKEYLENILTNSADAILALDEDGIIKTWNKGAEAMYGYKAEEVLGKHFRFLVPEKLRGSGEMEKIQKALEEKGYVKDYVTERLTKAGKKIIVNLTATLIRDIDGTVIGRSAIARDITETLELQKQLITAESLAAVGELASTVAHEVKNPLAGISGAIQLLGEGFHAADPRKEVIGEVLRQIERLDNTINDLLLFARPQVPRPQEVDLEHLLDKILAVLKEQPAMQRVEVGLQLDKGFALCADPQMIEQLLMNLLLNAAQAVEAKGKITVSAAKCNSQAVITISDTGKGIPGDILEKIYTPFFTTKHRGTGLGLSISKKIVEAHRGTIDVKSGVGVGTTFRICLPEEEARRVR